jgi:threonine aldolase
VLGSVQPQPIENEIDGSLCFKKIAAAIKPDDSHFAKTRLLSLENTIGGKVLPLEYLAQARDFVNAHNLALHLDGARAFNAAAELNVDITDITTHFDSVSICLSKGLGAPVGSLLLGSKTLIDKARRWRKVLGGGMRQAGMLAAAGQYALEHNVSRLSDDHANARYLAQQLSTVAGFNVNMANTTNMVYASCEPSINLTQLAADLKAQGILFSPSEQLRLVTHLDITRKDIDTFITALTTHI